MNIYDRINQLLKDKNVSRRELSEATDISYQTLSSLFYRQSKNMNLDTVTKIAEYFNVSVDYLILGENFSVKERAENYLTKHDDMDYEILRISRNLTIRDKNKLLSYAYELESSNIKKENA